MATAIIGGMVRSGEFKSDSIIGFDISEERGLFLRDKYGIELAANEKELVCNSQTVVLAVKPQVITSVFDKIREVVKGKLIVSIAAGKTVAFLEGGLGKDCRIVRVMPNINALVGSAVSAYVGNDNADAAAGDVVEKIFKTVGDVFCIPEKLFSVFTAIGGSSPAFAYMYVDALAKAGVQHGMPRDLAVKVAASTVMGSAKMILETGIHPIELCDRVCSPGGTTIDGVIRLQADGFEASVHDAVTAVVNKDKLL